MRHIKSLEYSTSRRSFLRTGLAGPGAIGAGLLVSALPSAAFADDTPTQGDVDILRFLAAAEIIETDLWQQYNELAGIQDSEVPESSIYQGGAEARRRHGAVHPRQHRG
jgi:hypothetical protein